MFQTVVTSTRRDRKLQASVVLLVVTGVLVALAFAMPQSVGRPMTSHGLLLVAMTFMGSVLAYIALLPNEAQLEQDVEST